MSRGRHELIPTFREKKCRRARSALAQSRLILLSKAWEIGRNFESVLFLTTKMKSLPNIQKIRPWATSIFSPESRFDVSRAEIKFYITEVAILKSINDKIDFAIPLDESWTYLVVYAVESQTIKSRHGAARRPVGIRARARAVFAERIWHGVSSRQHIFALHRLDGEYSPLRNKIPECGNIGIKRGDPMCSTCFERPMTLTHRRLRSCLRGSGL